MTGDTNWAEHTRRIGEQVAGLLGDADTSSADPASCRWCPLCQLLAVLRGERPGAAEALADVLATTATALRMLADDQAAAAPGGERDAAPSTASAAEPTAAVADPHPVQRIEIA